MFQPSFRIRRLASLLITSIALVLVAGVVTWMDVRGQREASMFTGFTLVSTVIVLMLLGVRRRLPVLPLGDMSSWTQFHLYLGFFSIGVFWLHVPMILGNRVLESWLSVLYLLSAGSGVYGICASRTLPKRMTLTEGQRRIGEAPLDREQIAQSANELVYELAAPMRESVLEGFYTTKLNPYFNSRPSLAYVMVPTGSRRRRLLGGLQELDRYLEQEGRNIAGRLATLIRRRDDLDYQFALRLRLRVWLVAHCILSVALLAGGILHGFAAWRYNG